MMFFFPFVWKINRFESSFRRRWDSNGFRPLYSPIRRIVECLSSSMLHVSDVVRCIRFRVYVSRNRLSLTHSSSWLSIRDWLSSNGSVRPTKHNRSLSLQWMNGLRSFDMHWVFFSHWWLCGRLWPESLRDMYEFAFGAFDCGFKGLALSSCPIATK